MSKLGSIGRVTSGALLGGVCAGVCEALARHAEVGYAAILYGSLWSAAFAIGAALISPWLRRLANLGFVRLGFVTTWGVSALVIGRFIIWRDIYHEAPGTGWRSFVWAFALASLSSTFAFFASSQVGRRMPTTRYADRLFWALPVGIWLTFVGFSLRPDDAFPVAPSQPAAARQTEGTIFIVVDTLRADALGIYGAGPHRGKEPSPHIDAVAKNGRIFDDATAQASWTRPAVASLLTSRHVSGHATMAKDASLPESLPTLASELQKHGIRTGAVVTNYNLEAAFGFARGFDSYVYLPPARYLGAPPLANRLSAYNVYRLLRERFGKNSREARHFYRSAQMVNAQAMDFIDRVDTPKFFLWLHYMEPHDPYFSVDGASFARVENPHPPVQLADAMLQAYRDDVQRIDLGIGELWTYLTERGLEDKVHLVFVADHGEEFGDHGGFFHGTTLYQEQIRVPFFMSGSQIPMGRDTRLVRQIDVAPTILGLYGINPPTAWEGINLLDLNADTLSALSEEDHEGNVLTALRQGSHKMIVANPNNPRGLKPVELYDLAHDPHEHQPLNRPDIHAAMQAEIVVSQNRARSGAAVPNQKPLNQDAAAELRSLGYVQ